MRTLLTLLALCLAANSWAGDDIEAVKMPDGKIYKQVKVVGVSANALQIVHAEGRATIPLQGASALTPSAAADPNQARQQMLAQQYAAKTGRTYDVCLQAVMTYEWCMAHPQGSVVGGVTYDAAATAQQLGMAMQTLGLGARPVAPAPVVARAGVIESSISGEFKGFEHGRVFKLLNGQIWEQTDFEYDYEYEYSPGVLIYPSGGRMMMRVDGVDTAVEVKQLK